MEILIKEKKLREAKDLAIKESGCNIQAENGLIHETYPLQLNEIALDTAIEHTASLTPNPVGGVLQAQIHDEKLFQRDPNIADGDDPL